MGKQHPKFEHDQSSRAGREPGREDICADHVRRKVLFALAMDGWI